MPSRGHILPSSTSLSPNCAGDRGERKGKIPVNLKAKGKGWRWQGRGDGRHLKVPGRQERAKHTVQWETGSSGVGKVIKKLQA